MRWREHKYFPEMLQYGDKTHGGTVDPAMSIDGFWASAWAGDACMRYARTYKTLKAAQRAVEKWLEKHG